MTPELRLPRTLATPGFVLVAAMCALPVPIDGALRAQSMAQQLVKSPSYVVTYMDTTLSNGLRVLLVENHFAPVVSGELFVNAGPRHEAASQSGIAHLLEHMMGSLQLREYLRRGGIGGGASTMYEHTDYFFIAPSVNLDAALFVNSEKLRRNYVDARDIVAERLGVRAEGGQRGGNQPYAKSANYLIDLYRESPSLRDASDSVADDLDAITAADLKLFHSKHYLPNTSVLVLVGDFKMRDALSRVIYFYDDLQQGVTPSPPRIVPIMQSREKRAVLRDRFATTPRIDIAYRTVSATAPDFPALNVLSAVVGRGDASFLHRRLVVERKLLSRVETRLDWRGFRHPTPLTIMAIVRQGVTADSAERAIYDELERMKTELVRPAEIERAKGLLARDFIRWTRGDGSRGLAFNLGYYAAVHGKPDLINTWLPAVDRATASDVRAAAGRYFGPENRTVVVTVPRGDTGGAEPRQ